MANVSRRLIIKPPAVTPERLTRLAEALQDAIHTQNRLSAKSPYILQFTGPLQENEQAFFVEHEPATGITPSELFSAEGPFATEEQLLQALAALADALAAAHAGGKARPVVHGGLCPGTLLIADDGLFRVTDFGFAPAICKTLGVDSYLNLAVGPHADGSGAWEILPPDVIDRDDRLCAFIDPDKYGSESLSSFELGSDIIAAGLVLYLLAEHTHPYLYFEPEAHRVVDMARAMGFGVPNVFARTQLCESSQPAVQAWLELVASMLARLPRERPAAAELAQRVKSAAPPVDLDTIKAQRWLAQLESLLEAKVWHELEALVDERPELKSWPADLLARAESIEARVREHLAEEGQRAAIDAERQAVAKWFTRLKSAVQGKDWETAQSLLDEKPRGEHWPEGVQEQLEPLTAKIAHAAAERKARAWQKVLQKAFEAKNWSGVGKLLAQRPALDPWPEDMQKYVTSVEAAHAEHLEEQEREQRRIAEQQQQARAWLEQAQALAGDEQWTESLDVLARPPELEHWPAGVHEEADRLLKSCRLHLTDAVATNLDQITETIRRHGESIVHEVLGQRLSGLVRPDRSETSVDLIIWAPPDSEADGRALLLVRLRSDNEEATGEPIKGELDFVLKDDIVQLCGGQEKFSVLVGDGLTQQLIQLQNAQLRGFERDLRATIFAEAAVQAEVDQPQPQVPAQINLLGDDGSDELQVDLLWRDEELSWTAVDKDTLAAEASRLATTVTQRVILADLLGRSQTLREYKSTFSIDLSVTEQPPPGELPTSLSFEVRGHFGPPERSRSHPLFTATAVCDHVGRASCDVELTAVETELQQLIVESQDLSREALFGGLKMLARVAATRPKISGPKRGKTPVGEITFEVRPKSGQAFALKAAWNTDTFTYEMPAGWEKKVEVLLGAVPESFGSLEAQTIRKARPAARRGVVIGGALAGACVVIVVGAYVGLRGGGEPTPPPAPKPTPIVQNDGGETTIVAEPPIETPAITETDTGTAPDTGEPGPVVVVTSQPGEEAAGPETAPPEPGPGDLVSSLAEYFNSDPDRFGTQVPIDELMQALIPPAEWDKEGSPAPGQAQFLAQVAIPESVIFEDFDPVGSERVAFDLKIELKGKARVSPQIFTMQRIADGWQPAPENPISLAGLAGAAKTVLLEAVRRARDDVASNRLQGNLTAAHAGFERVSAILPALADENEVSQLQDLMHSLPPAWEQLQADLQTSGYSADGEPEAATGYPARLRDDQGHLLRLVSLPPGDELWTRLGELVTPQQPLSEFLGLPEAERPWRIYYLDDAELLAANDFTQAVVHAENLGRELPTRDEWLLTALKLRHSPPTGLFGGLREWCTDNAEGAASTVGNWACGGVTRTVRGQEQVLPTPPENPGQLDEMWRWLNDPLVVQRRDGRFGDNLTGARPILRIFPR
ncbi:MAG: hypothetical protein KAY37_14985 [Phycisphaerae bacterium]|nr:hypothetical protein [Phycisphaerae bacterium]